MVDSSMVLNYLKCAQWEGIMVNRGIFLSGPPLNLLSVGWNVTDFKKALESQTGPPPLIEKV